MLADRDQSRRDFLYPSYSHPETIARGAAAVALKRTPESTTDDVLKTGLYEFGVVMDARTAATALAAHRMTSHDQER